MKFTVTIVFILSIVIISCSDKREPVNPENQVPQALEENDKPTRSFSKRSPENLVESIYQELVGKSPELKALEDAITELNKNKPDSVSDYENFRENNLSYFNAANMYIDNIKDSLLKQKMRDLITSGKSGFTKTVTMHDKLMEGISTNNLQIADLHKSVKIVTTLSVMENYWENNFLSTKPIEAILKKQEEILRTEEEIINKQ